MDSTRVRHAKAFSILRRVSQPLVLCVYLCIGPHVVFWPCFISSVCACVHVGLVPRTEMDLGPAVKVSEFKRVPPLGSCSADSYKQDLGELGAVLPCMASRQPRPRNMRRRTAPITQRLTATPASLPCQAPPQTITASRTHSTLLY